MKPAAWPPAWAFTGLGSLPLRDPAEAVDLILNRFPDFPFWPQLPPRSKAEDIRLQFAAGLPCLKADFKSGRVAVDPAADRVECLTAFYEAEMSNDLAPFALTSEIAPGFSLLTQELAARNLAPGRLKGQTIGPLTFLAAAKDAAGRMVLHDEELAQACARGLGLAGAWQAVNLPPTGHRPLIMIDDPGFYLVGSAHLGLDKTRAVDLLNQTVEPIIAFGGLAGVHSCANLDWSLLLNSQVQVLSFDAFSFGRSLILYADAVIGFLERGGVLAWGLVPTTAYTGLQSPDQLLALAEELKTELIKAGAPPARLEEQALLTPACGLGALSPDTALAVLDLLAATAELLETAGG